MRKIRALLMTVGLAAIASLPAAAKTVAAAPVAPAGAAIEASIARHDYREATRALNALVATRLPTTATGHPDPVLDRLFAQMIAAGGESLIAEPLLERIVANDTTPDAARYRLLLGIVRESAGDFPRAAQIYHDLVADGKNGLQARLGLARVQLVVDPAAAQLTLDAIPPAPPATGWEIALLSARAAFLTGHTEAGTAALEKAWTMAAFAPAADGAVAQVAMDRAALAGRNGDRQSLIALLSIDRLGRSANSGQNDLAATLPLCGQYGLSPDDQIIVQILREPGASRPRTSLVWATRPGIAAPFLIALAKNQSLTVTDGHSATFGLRCVKTVSAAYRVFDPFNASVVGWMSGQGVYPILPAEDDPATSTASLLAERETRFGADSVFILPALNNILAAGLTSDSYTTDGRKRSAQLSSRIEAILRKAEAPADLLLLAHLRTIGLETAAQIISPAAAQAAFAESMRQAASNPAVPLDIVYGLVNITVTSAAAPADLKAALLQSALDVFGRRSTVDDRRAQALAIGLMRLKYAANDAAAAKAVAEKYHIASDVCARADPELHFVSSEIGSNDYPNDLIAILLQGSSSLNFSLDAKGTAERGRIIVSDPPYGFDTIATSRLPTIRYDAARLDGQISSCDGASQTVRWQLPY